MPDPIELQKVQAKDLTVSILELTDPAWDQAALEAEGPLEAAPPAGAVRQTDPGTVSSAPTESASVLP